MNTKVNVKSTGLKTRESMKISELDFIKKQDLRKLSSYGELTIKEFVNFIESLTSKGGYVKKLFQEIYDGLYDNLTDFPELIEEDVMEVHKTYPMTVETKTGLFLNINTALQEMASVLKSRVENNRCTSRYSYPSFGSETFPIRRVASIFYHIYLQNKTEKEVSSIMGIGLARVQNIHCKTLTSLLNGDTIFDDIKFNDELLDWINTFKKESLCQSLSYMGITNVIVPEKILNVLGFDVVDFSQFNHKEKLGEILPEQGIIVKRGQKSKYSQVLRALISELRNVIIPISKEELINQIDKTAIISNMSDKYDNEFVERVLSMSEIVVCEDELYYLRREFLSTDIQRVARIIYENYPIDTVSVQEKFEEIYGCPVKILHHWFKDCSFIVHRNRQWTIKGKELLPIKEYIAQYVETKKVFFLNEL